MLFHNYICFFLSLSTQLNRKKEVFFSSHFSSHLLFYQTTKKIVSPTKLFSQPGTCRIHSMNEIPTVCLIYDPAFINIPDHIIS